MYITIHRTDAMAFCARAGDVCVCVACAKKRHINTCVYVCVYIYVYTCI